MENRGKFDVIVIGAGVAGLTAAWKLHQENVNVLVMEGETISGGHVNTVELTDYRLEMGPHSFMGSSEYIWKLVSEMGLESAVAGAEPVSDNRYILRDGQVVPLPMSLGSFLSTPLLSARGKLRLIMEPFIPGNATDEGTAWEFFVRRFGKEAATYIMSPFISGVYAGDAKMLGARAAFPKFWEFEKNTGSMILGSVIFMWKKKRRLAREKIAYKKGLYSFKGGLGKITRELTAGLGESVLTGEPVRSVEQTETGWKVSGDGVSAESKAVISAIPPDRLRALTPGFCPGMTELLGGIPMSPVAVIHWTAELPRHPTPGFGVLVPRIYDTRVLGTLFPSELFTDRAPKGQHLFVSFYGGMTDPGAAELPDDALVDLMSKEHAQMFNFDRNLIKPLKIIRYPAGIPQMMPRHPEVVQDITRELNSSPGFFLAGNYLTGVGIEHAVKSGFTAFSQCRSFLNQTQSSAG